MATFKEKKDIDKFNSELDKEAKKFLMK